MEVARRAGVVACRDDLHGRDVQERCDADVCEGGGEGGSRKTSLSTSAVWYRVLAKMRKVALNFPSA